MQVIKGQTEIDSFVRHVEEESGSKFVCISVDRGFTDKDWQPLPSNRVYWQWSGGDGTPSIAFTGVPFMFMGGKRLGCYRGKDRAVAQKKKYAELKARRTRASTTEEDFGALVQASRSPFTKKVGCPASISISKIAMFPKFKVGDTRERTRKRTSKALRLSLLKDPMVWETGFVITHHSEHSGHQAVPADPEGEADPEGKAGLEGEAVTGRKRRRRSFAGHESANRESPSQKRARKAYLKKKCIRLAKRLLDRLSRIGDQDKLQELSGKLAELLNDLLLFSNSENQRPDQTEAGRPAVSFTATLTHNTPQVEQRQTAVALTPTLTLNSVSKLKSKDSKALETKLSSASVTSVPVWSMQTVSDSL